MSKLHKLKPNCDGYVRHCSESKLNTGFSLNIEGNPHVLLVSMLWKSKAQMFHWCGRRKQSVYQRQTTRQYCMWIPFKTIGAMSW